MIIKKEVLEEFGALTKKQKEYVKTALHSKMTRKKTRPDFKAILILICALIAAVLGIIHTFEGEIQTGVLAYILSVLLAIYEQGMSK